MYLWVCAAYVGGDVIGKAAESDALVTAWVNLSTYTTEYVPSEDPTACDGVTVGAWSSARDGEIPCSVDTVVL